MPFEKDPNEKGAIWKRIGARGEWLSICINDEWYVAFPTNSKGRSGKGPDYRIMLQKPREVPPEPATKNDDDEAPF